MATADKNAKSQLLKARVPHEIVDMMNTLKRPDESTSQFIINAVISEIEKRKAPLNEKETTSNE
ncbi:TPA: hypothetical protein L9L73_000482 [Klebsiella pneumoniae]|nr:hypothetical protein [Klebsiella pneumoniae]HBW7322444.1 hypothetical protein [Klebsiella pneumoniae]HDG7829756.1 hypothetical protein [Klebsiella quasipneumoniae]